MKKKLSEMTLEELWQLFPIILTEHNPLWSEWYKKEERILSERLPRNEIKRIGHIGSTAIDTIWAKPTVDILVEANQNADWKNLENKITECGYDAMSREDGRISFHKGYTEDGFAEKVFHLHLRRAGINDELYFRDYLIDNPIVAKEYEKMKLELWKKYEHNRDAYTESKTEFIKNIPKRQKNNIAVDTSDLRKYFEQNLIFSCADYRSGYSIKIEYLNGVLLMSPRKSLVHIYKKNGVNVKKITKEQARNYLVCYHNLDGQRGYKGEKGTLEYFKQVGSVQFDPLKVAGRNADLTLQSSVGNYTPAVMEKLLYSDRKLVDGWDKMQSVFMQDDWAHFSYTIKNQKENYIRWLKRIGSSEILDYVGEIRKMLEENGPLPSTKIDFGGRLDTGWGRGKASAITLDFMLKTGEIGVRNKQNAVKVYDLSERLISEENYKKENPFKNEAEFTDWLTLRRIGSVGLLWTRNGGGWLGSRYLENRKCRTDALKRLLEKELIEEIAVDGFNEIFYIRKSDEVFLDAVARNSAKIIAPLDNMI